MDMSSCLLIIFIPQGRLDSIHAELQVQNVICSLDGLIKAVLQKERTLIFNSTLNGLQEERRESGS